MASSYPTVTPDQGGATFISKQHNEAYPFISKANHTGRSIFITGGARGIGKSIALSFAKAGASRIALGDINEFGNLGQELRDIALENGHNAPLILLFHLDVTDKRNVAEVAAKVKQEFNANLDIVIQNAGYSSAQIRILDIDEDDWWTCFRVNLLGVFHVSKYFVPILLDTTQGLKTVININSVASIGVRPYSSNYAASKAAVLKFTEAFLAEEMGRGLLAISVHPGAVMSEMTKIAMPQSLFHLFKDPPSLAGQTIAWLTQERRDWLQGRWISCNWDMEELLARKQEILGGDKLKMRLKI
ncbi:hypothetical protein BJX99DRAFT_253240 [Aspergillus californicus]